MKILDRLAVLLLNLCLAAVAILAPALLLASSPAYYRYEFEKTKLYAHEENGQEVRAPIHYLGGDARRTAYFTDAQLDTLAHHIIDFLFGDTEDFSLTMDGVNVNGKEEDGVAVFGDAAVFHMADVKQLMHTARAVTIAAGALLPLLLLFLILRRRQAGRFALFYTLLFYFIILLLAAAFCFFALRGAEGDLATAFWQAAHHLFFPFRPDKVAGSFFNDTLTSVLTLPLFMDAVYTVLATFAAALVGWLLLALFLRRSATR